MIKTTYICDSCKNEMPQPSDINLFIAAGDLFSVEIVPFLSTNKESHRNINGPSDLTFCGSSNLHFCKYCVIDLIVNKLDDRPKEKA